MKVLIVILLLALGGCALILKQERLNRYQQRLDKISWEFKQGHLDYWEFRRAAGYAMSEAGHPYGDELASLAHYLGSEVRAGTMSQEEAEYRYERGWSLVRAEGARNRAIGSTSPYETPSSRERHSSRTPSWADRQLQRMQDTTPSNPNPRNYSGDWAERQLQRMQDAGTSNY